MRTEVDETVCLPTTTRLGPKTEQKTDFGGRAMFFSGLDAVGNRSGIISGRDRNGTETRYTYTTEPERTCTDTKHERATPSASPSHLHSDVATAGCIPSAGPF